MLGVRFRASRKPKDILHPHPDPLPQVTLTLREDAPPSPTRADCRFSQRMIAFLPQQLSECGWSGFLDFARNDEKASFSRHSERSIFLRSRGISALRNAIDLTDLQRLSTVSTGEDRRGLFRLFHNSGANQLAAASVAVIIPEARQRFTRPCCYSTRRGAKAYGSASCQRAA